jgi:hypothetical protein
LMAKWERVEQCPRDGSLLRWQHAKSTFYRALTHKAAEWAVQFATLSSQQTLIVSANLVMPKCDSREVQCAENASLRTPAKLPGSCEKPPAIKTHSSLFFRSRCGSSSWNCIFADSEQKRPAAALFYAVTSKKTVRSSHPPLRLKRFASNLPPSRLRPPPCGVIQHRLGHHQWHSVPPDYSQE